MPQLKLQELIDLLYPDEFGTEFVYIKKRMKEGTDDASPREDSSLRIPVFQRMKPMDRVRVAAFIIEKMDCFTDAAIAEALKIDKAQLSRWKWDPEKENKELTNYQTAYKSAVIFLIGIYICSKELNLFKASEKFGIDAKTIFEWQGKLGMQQGTLALQRLRQLLPESYKKKLEFLVNIDHSIDQDHEYWKYEFKKHKEPVDEGTIKTTLAKTPHKEFLKAHRLYNTYQQQKESTVFENQDTENQEPSVEHEERNNRFINPPRD